MAAAFGTAVRLKPIVNSRCLAPGEDRLALHQDRREMARYGPVIID
jgi:hypothetical protein